MSTATRTFYEVLGVKRSATAQDIEQAYARLRTQMEDASGAHDARRAAVAKAAYTTLVDSASRAEYDDSLGLNKPRRAKKPDVMPWAVGGCVALLALAVLGYQWHSNRAAAAAPEDGVDVPRLVRDMGPRVGRLQAAFVSGEVRDLGLAVETGEGEMMSACGVVPPGTALTVDQGPATLRADVASVRDNGLCVLGVPGAHDGIKVRSSIPPPRETLQAVVRTAEGVAARELAIERTLLTPHGTAFALKATAALPNGTPVFDMRERLVAIVVSLEAQGTLAVPVKETRADAPRR